MKIQKSIMIIIVLSTIFCILTGCGKSEPEPEPIELTVSNIKDYLCFDLSHSKPQESDSVLNDFAPWTEMSSFASVSVFPVQSGSFSNVKITVKYEVGPFNHVWHIRNHDDFDTNYVYSVSDTITLPADGKCDQQITELAGLDYLIDGKPTATLSIESVSGTFIPN